MKRKICIKKYSTQHNTTYTIHTTFYLMKYTLRCYVLAKLLNFNFYKEKNKDWNIQNAMIFQNYS